VRVHAGNLPAEVEVAGYSATAHPLDDYWWVTAQLIDAHPAPARCSRGSDRRTSKAFSATWRRERRTWLVDELGFHRRRTQRREDIIPATQHLAEDIMWNTLYALRSRAAG
jgi:hypothetical protein